MSYTCRGSAQSLLGSRPVISAQLVPHSIISRCPSHYKITYLLKKKIGLGPPPRRWSIFFSLVENGGLRKGGKERKW